MRIPIKGIYQYEIPILGRYGRAITALLLVIVALSIRTPQITTAQDTATPAPLTCSKVLPLVNQHLSQDCGTLDRNELCYGNKSLSVDYVDGATTDSNGFTKQGDVIPVNIVKSVNTGPLNLETGEFGLAVLKMQANLPGTTAGQAVTFVLYGDVSLKSLPTAPNTATEAAPSELATDSSGETPTALPSCNATTGRATYLRAAADPNGNKLLLLPPNTSAPATGRNSDGSWVYSEYQGTKGWLYNRQNNLTLACDVNTLPVMDNTLPPIDGSNINAVQPTAQPATFPGSGAFYFSTGISAQAACNDLPTGGMLIQTPQGTKVNFRLNGADIVLGSIMWAQVVPGQQGKPGLLTLSLLEGQSTVEVGLVKKTLRPGQQLSIPLGGNDPIVGGLDAVDAPTAPKPMPYADKQKLCKFAEAANFANICQPLLATVAPRPTAVPTVAAPNVPAATVAVPSVGPTNDFSCQLQGFSADSTSLTIKLTGAGVPQPVCTTLRWDAEGVNAVFLNGAGVVGHGSQQVCFDKAGIYRSVLTIECNAGRKSAGVSITVR